MVTLRVQTHYNLVCVVLGMGFTVQWTYLFQQCLWIWCVQVFLESFYESINCLLLPCFKSAHCSFGELASNLYEWIHIIYSFPECFSICMFPNLYVYWQLYALTPCSNQTRCDYNDKLVCPHQTQRDATTRSFKKQPIRRSRGRSLLSSSRNSQQNR